MFWLWIGAKSRSVHCLDYGKGENAWRTFTPKFKPPIPENEHVVTDILADKDNNIWISYGYQGLVKLSIRDDGFEQQNFFPDRSDPHSLLSQTCIALMRDRTDMLWIGTLNGV